MSVTEKVMITGAADIKEYIALGFTGKAIFRSLRATIIGNIEARDFAQVGGVWQHTGEFDTFTVTRRTGGAPIGTFRLCDVAALEVRSF